jgi:hypothetical protein
VESESGQKVAWRTHDELVAAEDQANNKPCCDTTTALPKLPVSSEPN